MKSKFLFSSILFVLCLMLSCGDKGIEEPVPPKPEVPEVPKEPEEPEDPLPTTDTENWLYRQNKENGKKEKFFGIGTWHLPGYPLSETQIPETEEAKQIYREISANFNIIFLDPRYMKPHMAEKTQMISNFSNVIHGYLDKIAGLPKGTDKDYYRSQYLKANVNSPEFVKLIEDNVDYLKSTYQNFDRIYAPIDEIAMGGVSKWFIPSTVGDLMYEIIKKKETDPVVFVDLLGHGRGSTFFFEQNYLKEHSTMPGRPPYDLLSENARKQTTLPLLGFSQAYDGTTVYDFDSNGNYAYRNLSIGALKNIWFENVKRIAEAYKNNGNVFSINAFRDFHASPVLAGVTVDAMKTGLGDKPIWLYFDGNGYAKPASMTPKSYINSVKCQIYTSIVHGATGVFFWNDWSKTPEVFSDALLPMLKELNEHLDIIYLPTIERKITEDLHVMIKQDSNGKKYIIAVNSNKTNTVTLGIQGLQKTSLSPMEVYISPML